MKDTGALETLLKVMTTMATSERPLRERLLYAGEDLAPLTPEDFPREERTEAEYLSLMTAMSSVEPKGDEGRIAATLAAVSDEEVRRLAGLLCNLIEGVVRNATASEEEG